MRRKGYRVRRVVPSSWRCLTDIPSDHSEDGFTLIELLIVIIIVPFVVGAITVALISVFSTQSSVSNRLSDSGDAQIVSSHLVMDVDSATSLIAPTAGAPTGQNPATCGTSTETELLSLQSESGQMEISYVEAPNGTSNSENLVRNVCQGGNSSPQSSSVVSYDISSGQTTATVTCGSTSQDVAECASYQTGWIPTSGVTGVKFTTTEPSSQYSYTLVAVPKTSTNQNQLSTVATSPTSSCGFASPGSGTYAPSSGTEELCFVDFSAWNTQTAASGISCNGAGTPAGALPMAAGISGTPYTLTFCLAVSYVKGPATGATPCPGYFNGVDVGYDDICAVSLPTYFDPPTSEAFLGNNGFYTGVPGNPALYTAGEGSTATVTMSQIQVLDSNDIPATGWYLITGDAESTDSGESLTWTAGWGSTSPVPASDQVFNLVWNTPASQGPPVVAGSPVGNACDSTPPTWNTTYLTGLGTKTVKCSNVVSSDKTGTVMLEAPAPSSLTAVLQGTGLQAIFIGLLLPS